MKHPGQYSVGITSFNGQFPVGANIASDSEEIERVVFMFDEAQTLEFQHLFLLKALVDELIDLKLVPFVLLVAQPEIKERREDLLEKNYQDIIDRFFTRWHLLRGLKLDEFENFLAYYDTMRWPEPNGPTFTGYFAGPQVKRGWELRSCAAELKERFCALSKNAGYHPLLELETKFLTAAVSLLLTSIQKANAEGVRVVMPQLIAQSVQRSGLPDVRLNVKDSEHVVAPKRNRLAP